MRRANEAKKDRRGKHLGNPAAGSGVPLRTALKITRTWLGLFMKMTCFRYTFCFYS